MAIVGQVTRQLPLSRFGAVPKRALDAAALTRFAPLLLVADDALGAAEDTGIARCAAAAQGRVGVGGFVVCHAIHAGLLTMSIATTEGKVGVFWRDVGGRGNGDGSRSRGHSRMLHSRGQGLLSVCEIAKPPRLFRFGTLIMTSGGCVGGMVLILLKYRCMYTLAFGLASWQSLDSGAGTR